MKILGIDYGAKRIGLAISDENKTMAFPREIVLNDKNIFKNLVLLFKEENIGEIVVGDSRDLAGELNKISEQIEIFISKLKSDFHLPVHKQKEFFTSVEARKVRNTKQMLNQSESHSKIKKKRIGKVDANAAALILQRYLDKKK